MLSHIFEWQPIKWSPWNDHHETEMCHTNWLASHFFYRICQGMDEVQWYQLVPFTPWKPRHEPNWGNFFIPSNKITIKLQAMYCDLANVKLKIYIWMNTQWIFNRPLHDTKFGQGLKLQWFLLLQNLWHQLKEHLRRHVKPQTKEELVAGIRHFWSEMVTPELCRRYIGHLKTVWPLVLQEKGGPTGH